MKSELDGTDAVLIITMGVLLTPFSWAMRACFFILGWRWFVVPTFGVDMISWPVALGLSAMLWMACGDRGQSSGDEAYDVIAKMIISTTLVPAFGILSVYIIHLFI